MLNQTTVLEYIKDNLAFPHMQLEMSDEEITEYTTKYSLKEFSRFFPQVVSTGINLELAMYKVPGYQNRYYIFDPDELEILNIVDVIMPLSGDLLLGHPYRGVLSYWEAPQFALDVEMARSAKKFSEFDYNFFFHHPNILEIRPLPRTSRECMVEYERMQHPSLTYIPNDLQHLYLDLCLADIQIKIGRIRKKYADGNLRTPWGDIPIGSEIFDEGKEMKRELIEKFERYNLPNVTIDIG